MPHCVPALTMATFKKSVHALLFDAAEPYGKPYGARLSLVCPHPDTRDPLALGLREGTSSRPIIGLDGGEGHSAVMNVGAAVWWVVEPRPSELPLPMMCLMTGQVEFHRVNVEFAGSPADAVDYLVHTRMHPSAAIFGATLHTTKDAALAAVGDLGVAISTRGSAWAGRAGVAISMLGEMTATAGPDGIAIGSMWAGVAFSGDRGQSYTGQRGVSRSGRDGVAVAGEEGRATATHVVVGARAEAEVLDGTAPMFAAGEGSRVHAGGTTFRAGIDFEPGVAYRVHFPLGEPPTLERYPDLDAFAVHTALNAGCSLTGEALARYFLDERPLCSPAARERGLAWTSTLRRPDGPLELPEGTRSYLDEMRYPYRRLVQ